MTNDLTDIEILNLIKDIVLSFNRPFTIDEVCVRTRNLYCIDDMRMIIPIVNYLLDKKAIDYQENDYHDWKFINLSNE